MVLRRRRRVLVFLGLGLFALFLGLLATAQYLARSASQGRIFDRVEDVPARKVALVPGCSRFVRGGAPNHFFANRIAAAAALFRAGKAQYFLLSGDNHVAGYDEAGDMADALVLAGVPRERIVCDYAGFSTLDSIVRAKEVFGEERILVVSQAFHNRRALLIARMRGVDAVAYNAAQPELRFSLRTALREQLALVRTLADLTILRREPHFLGPRIEIGNAVGTPAAVPKG